MSANGARCMGVSVSSDKICAVDSGRGVSPTAKLSMLSTSRISLPPSTTSSSRATVRSPTSTNRFMGFTYAFSTFLENVLLKKAVTSPMLVWVSLEFSLSESGDLEPGVKSRLGVDGLLELRGSNRFRILSLGLDIV